MPEEAVTVERLHRLETVRERAWMLLAAVERGESEHFNLSPESVSTVALALASAIRETTPDLRPPLATLWPRLQRDHPAAVEQLAASVAGLDGQGRAMAGADMALLALLIAPDGSDPGLGALARFFAAGGTTTRPADGPALHAPGLRRILAGDATVAVPDELQPALQEPGVRQRLETLAAGLEQDPDSFGADGRFGAVLDRLAGQARSRGLSAQELLDRLAPLLDPVAGSTVRIGGSLAGDIWRHPLAWADDRSRELVPFHCLLQALVLNLLEPLAEADIKLDGLEELTVPATRGLAADILRLGLVHPRHAAVARLRHPPGSDIVVELRALSIALADRLVDRLRQELNLTVRDLPAVRIVGPLAQLAANWRDTPGHGIAITGGCF
ncbi:MAG: DUF1688 family protein [Geminicoccaceae bacterium]